MDVYSMDSSIVRKMRLFSEERRWYIGVPSKGFCTNFACGGCRHCGLPGDKGYPAYSIAALETELGLIPRDIGLLAIKAACSGSWSEIPEEGRRLVYEHVRMLAIGEFQIESRPELIDQAILDELRHELPETRTEVGLGLDHWNNWARNSVLRRNTRLQEYHRALKLVNKAGLISRTFVAIGLPLGWSEREAIDGAIRTATRTMMAGSKRIWLEPLVLQPLTLQRYLYDRGLWKPIFLWSIREVMLGIHHFATEFGVTVELGGKRQFPLPTVLPTNRCPICENQFRSAFGTFTADLDVSELLALDCKCHNEWAAALDRMFVTRRQVPGILREFDRTRFVSKGEGL